ncbi:signal peptide peptidase SppA [Arboricoccus pini]|uniref:Signal peptide peptidase SppA n=2 Tax=Arboricoccus pini TaxID=1963835 RepID=A0A212QN00_9PROT|nr:signal peptide peptidase SppA [Arboricoccus pini]
MLGKLRRFFRRKHGKVIPAVRLQGVIGSRGLSGGLTLAALEKTLEEAFADKKAPIVLLLVNSPGGSPVQSSLIASRIRGLAESKNKHVIAIVEDVAASGGYWLATAADEIFVDPSSLLGSIGVISAGFGFTEAIAKIGIERRVHTAGQNKALLDPFRPEQPEDLLLLSEIQSDIHAAFKEQVVHRRAGRLRLEEKGLFEGKVWTGRRAVEIGLADGIATAHELIRQRFGKKARIRVIQEKRSWLARRLRFGVASAVGDAAEAITTSTLSALEDRILWQRFGL